MRVLLLLAHPRPVSFTGALAEAYAAGLIEAGHEVERGDLYRERFDADFRIEDFGQFDPGGPAPPPADVQAEQQRISRNEALALVFPVWWWSFPAILKGWIDRVMTEGWAYRFTPERVEGLLRLKKVVLIGSGGSTATTYRRYGYHGAMQRAIDAGIFGYCGVGDVETHIFPEVDSAPMRRPGYIDRARELGRALALREGGAFHVV